MRAVVYHGPRDVRVDNKPMPIIEDRDDVIVKVTTTAICGSDLHLYHGNVEGMEPGQTLGHEFMGIVVEAGEGVTDVKKGDRVVIPFNISCGKYEGGQAEYVRVPFADTECLKVPENLKDEQVIFLSDILPTGYFGTDITNVRPGDDVIVYGAGAVGYFAVLSAFLRGAAMVISVDSNPARLNKTRKLGAETINFKEHDPVEIIKDLTRGQGGICIDCVGYEAVVHHGHNHKTAADAGIINPAYPDEYPMRIFEWMTETARKFSTLGVPGVYMTAYNGFPLGKLFQKELQIRMGQCPVKNYNGQLLHLIEKGRIDPTPIISHTLKLDKAPEGYSMFDAKNGCTKVIMHP